MIWEGNGGKWGVLATMSPFRERTVERPHGIGSIAMGEWFGRGMCPLMKCMGFFFTLYFFGSVNVCAMH